MTPKFRRAPEPLRVASGTVNTVNTWHLWVYRCQKSSKTRLNHHLSLKSIIALLALREARFMKSFSIRLMATLTSKRNRTKNDLYQSLVMTSKKFQALNQLNHAFVLINIPASHPTLAAIDQRLTRNLDANNADDQHGDEDPRDWRNRILEKD